MLKTFIKTTFITSLLTLASSSFAVTAEPNHPAAADNINVSPQERAKIEQVVHQYLLRKPEVIVEVLQLLQQKQYDQAQQTLKQTQQMAGTFVDNLFHQANDPVAGNPNGKITVVEFFDYQCPHCVDMAPVIDGIIKANPNVRFVFKEFPIRGPMSDFAARAALAANQQGKYYPFSHALLLSGQSLSKDAIYQMAQANGIDVEKMKKAMTDDSVDKQIKANLKLAQDLKLLGTPAFFIGKSDAKSTDKINYVPGQMDQKQMQDVINKAQ